MVQESAHKSIWQTTDAMIVITLLVGYILNSYVYSFSEILSSDLTLYSVGGLFLFIGLTAIILAKKAFLSEEQPSGPGKPTTKVVDTGIFSYSRNPLYLGIIITLIGIGVIFSNFWYVLLSIPLGLVIHFVLVLPEERYLFELFGKDYKAYTKNVRRWL